MPARKQTSNSQTSNSQTSQAVATLESPDALALDARRLKTVVRPRATWGPAQACALSLDGTTLTIAATNGEVGVWCHLPCASATGALDTPMLVSGEKFIQIALALSDGPVTITLGDAVLIEAPHIRSRLEPINEDVDWWQPPRHGDTPQTIDGATFIQALRRVRRAASTDEHRPTLHGVCVDPSDGDLIAVATDGHRLLADVCADSAPFRQPIILPLQSLKLLENINDESTRISCENNRFILSDSRVVCSIALVSGAFPDWRRVIPSPEVTMTARTDALKRALSVVSVMSDSNRRVAVMARDQQCQFEASCEPGGATAEVPITGPNRVWPRVILNVDYLLDAVSAMDSEEIELSIIGQEKPVLLRSAGSRYPLAVIMPMRES